MKFKAGDRVYVTTTSFNIKPGIYTITKVLSDNIDSHDGKLYPYDIEELPVNLREDEVREVTPLEELL